MPKKSNGKSAKNLGYARKAEQQARNRYTWRDQGTTYFLDSKNSSGFYTAGLSNKKLKNDMYRGYQDFKPLDTYKSKMAKRKPKRAR